MSELPELRALAETWMPVGLPGFSGADKLGREQRLDGRFGPDGWRWGWYVRGEIVPFERAIVEYEQSYRALLSRSPAVVDWLVAQCGNVYDHSVANAFDDDYRQPRDVTNHYQDISVRRVVAELTGAGPALGEPEELVDLGTGERHRVPRASGFEGRYLGQIRGLDSPLALLNPAVVPVHDPLLITTLPARQEWYHTEGCAHLSVEAFWQMSKVIEVRYDRFVALDEAVRADPLAAV